MLRNVWQAALEVNQKMDSAVHVTEVELFLADVVTSQCHVAVANADQILKLVLHTPVDAVEVAYEW